MAILKARPEWRGTGNDDNAINFYQLNLGLKSHAGLILGGGTSGDPVTTSDADKKWMSFYLESKATSGDNRALYLRFYLSGEGGGGEAARIFTTVNDVAASTVHGAHISLSFGSSGSVTGQGIAGRNTLHIPDASLGGGNVKYSALQAEIFSDGSSSDPNGNYLSCIRCLNAGDSTGMAVVDDDCALFDIEGFVDATGNMLYGSTLRIRVANADRFLVMSTAENTFTYTGAMVLTGALTVGTSGVGHDVTFYGDTPDCDFFWDQNGDTNGLLSLGTSAGSKGVDFLAYGDTAGNYLHWDQSGDDLLLVGTSTQLAVAGDTDASSITTGSLRTAGGLGVVKKAYIGTGIDIGASASAAIMISGASTTAGLHLASLWGQGADNGGILVAADASGTALALGAATTEIVVNRVNVTAAVTNNSNFMANYTTMATSGAMEDGFIMGHYIRCNINHLAYENYAIYGRMNVTVAQTGDSGNQYIGVFGNTTMSGHAHALTDTGGCYGVLGVASIASGGTLDQPLIAGYFDCDSTDNITGVTLAVRARMQHYTDYGVEVFCQTSNAIAGFHIRATKAAALPVGILFTGENVGGQGSITKAFKFAAATNCGIATNTSTLTLAPTSHHIVVDIAGIDYYVPIFDNTSWT